MYCKMENNRLNFLRHNQKALRADVYQGLLDGLQRGELNGILRGRRIVLPSSFYGGPRNMMQSYQDAMALVRAFGKPDLFITMTCNPKWPEIKQALEPQQPENDRPDLVARVFNMKLQALLHDLTKPKGLLGRVVAHVHVVEFQKRGLPHAHILLILDACCMGPVALQSLIKRACKMTNAPRIFPRTFKRRPGLEVIATLRTAGVILDGHF